MIIGPVPSAIPEWTLGDRLRKAREHARLTQAELAADMEVHRTSVISYEGGRTVPSRPVLLSWSMATGVLLAWLLGDARQLAEAAAS